MTRVFHFEHIPRRNRAKGLVPKLRRCSKQFRIAVAAGDNKRQFAVSQTAWKTMTELFDVLRNAQDHGHLSATPMNIHTGLIANGLSLGEQQSMLSLTKIDRSLSSSLSLRNALNKIAHHKDAAFRVDGRNAHYILLGGKFDGKHWVAEILVSRLCKNAAMAIQAITG